MKSVIPALLSVATLTLAACGAPSTGGGVGFGTAAAPQSAGASAGAASMPEGLYKTRTGVPWKVYRSSNAKRGGTPLSERSAMRSATSYGSHLWSSPNAVKIVNGRANGMFRITTIDGHTFGVVRKLRIPGQFVGPEGYRKEYMALARKGIAMAGCKPRGDDLGILAQGYGIVAAAMGADC